MTTLSINVPVTLAKASQEAAKELGISRTQFIRQAIMHELEHYQAKLEEDAMIICFNAMKKNKNYLKETQEMDNTLNSDLPNEDESWWTN